MARPLRIEYPGAYYHVMNRGNRREDIFLTDKDRQLFVDGLADSCDIYNVRLIAYVLMSNHVLCRALHKKCYVKPRIM
jgi:REP element-mobilizing transposase RayT